jgi:hypothetical protein
MGGMSIDGWPYGHHEFDPHAFELRHHRRRIWPIGRIEFVLTLQGPVEEIGNDDIGWQPAALVLTSHREQFLLRLVTQFALPET